MTMIVAALVLVVCAIVVVAISVFVGSNLDSVQRYCITATNNESAFLNGVMETNTESDTISYTLYYDNFAGDVTVVSVHGPINPITQVGAVNFFLCGGAASGPTCFPTSGGYLNATRLTVYTPPDSVEDPLSFILNVRATPWLYYLQLTAGATVLRAPLNMLCGTP